MERSLIIKSLIGMVCVGLALKMMSARVAADCFAYPHKDHRSPLGPHVVTVEPRVCPRAGVNLNVAWLSPGGLGDENFPVVVFSEGSARTNSSDSTPLKEPSVCWLDERRVEIHYFGNSSIQQNPDVFGQIEVRYVKHLSTAETVECADASPSE